MATEAIRRANCSQNVTTNKPAVCKKLDIGLFVVTFWLELCMSYSSSCHHHPVSSHKIQKGDIPVLANQGPPGKWLLKQRAIEHLAGWHLGILLFLCRFVWIHCIASVCQWMYAYFICFRDKEKLKLREEKWSHVLQLAQSNPAVSW